MGIVNETVALDEETLARIQEELIAEGLEAWLLYNFLGVNPVASALLGLPSMTRRYFVLIPAHGRPVALTHRIEQQPWTGWIGERRVYLSWRELESELRGMLDGRVRVAMEFSEGDAVPYVDRTPAGVLQMVRAAGPEIVTSANLVSAFYARWSAEGEAGHRRAAAALREAAHAAFARIGEQLRSGESPNEWDTREWIAARLHDAGLAVGGDAIVGVNANAANPHYAPTREQSAPITHGDLVLIDLWGKENENSIYADQTWMGYVGREIPDRVRSIWEVVRDARDAGISLITERSRAGRPVAGYEVDDVVRAHIAGHGFGEYFIHRTGHSIDRELHGSGPNIDNLETRDTRRLIDGIGFSIEPGIYLPGDLGFRTEVDVYMGPNGPEVTTPDPQRDLVVIEA